MAKFLNEYYSVISPTGKKITVKRDNGLFDNNNPWTYIKEANRRYKPLKKGEYIIEKGTDSGYEPLVDDSDKDYWTNYINTIENKVKDKPSQNFWQYTFKRMEPIKKQGGTIKIKKKNKGKFTESAKRAGKSVQEHARDVVNDPKATKLQKRRAQFALNSKKFKHQNGNRINYLNLF